MQSLTLSLALKRLSIRAEDATPPGSVNAKETTDGKWHGAGRLA